MKMLTNFDNVNFHWGFYVGSQIANYNVTYKAEDEKMEAGIPNKLGIGFHLGIVTDWRINSYMNIMLEPGFISQPNTLEFVHPDLLVKKPRVTTRPAGSGTAKKEDDFEPFKREVQANYIYLPVVLKLSGLRFDNVKPYGLLGVSYAYNISSNEKSEKDNGGADGTYGNQDDKEDGVFRMTPHNFMYELGVGLDIYFPYFKMSPSVRAVFNIMNQMVPDTKEDSPYTAPIESFKMSGLFFRLTFQ